MSERMLFRFFSRKVVAFAIIALAAVASAVGVVAYQRSEAAEVRSLPSAERATLYERTLETLNSTCAHTRGEALVGYCREQAEFLARFPECNDDCQQTCRQFFPRPTK
jgi:hypothetical protein